MLRSIKFGFILFLFVLTRTTLAQMLDKTNMWYERETRYIVCKSANCKNDVQTVTNIYTLGKDTIIGGKSYSKIIDTIYSENGQYIISSPGCIRQEGKKFYFRPSYLDELLIYDFSLLVGSTFSTYSQLYTVTKLDSIKLSGKNYLSIQLIDKEDLYPENNDTLNWIEGIGAEEGFLYPVNAKGLLLCFYNSQDLIYQNQSGYECKERPAEILNVQKKFNFTIFPNPASGVISIKGQEPINSIQLINVFGEVICYERINGLLNFKFNLPGNLSGFYFVKINSSIKKLIIH
jgi:hypothetical protein